MYAVIETGSKQYIVQAGDTIVVERLEGENGGAVRLDKVLLVVDENAVKIGTPYVEGAAVTGAIVSQERGEKIVIHKYRKRKHYARTRGHRQYHTRVRIQSVQVS